MMYLITLILTLNSLVTLFNEATHCWVLPIFSFRLLRYKLFDGRKCRWCLEINSKRSARFEMAVSDSCPLE